MLVLKSLKSKLEEKFELNLSVVKTIQASRWHFRFVSDIRPCEDWMFVEVTAH